MSDSGDKLFDRMGTVVGVFGAAYALWVFVAVCSLVGGWQDKLGVFGDSFGVINALFSGGAIMFVAFTIWQQQKLIEQGQKQLRVQEDELRQNTEALVAQKIEMEAQNRYLAKQTLQNQVFQLVNSWREYTSLTIVWDACEAITRCIESCDWKTGADDGAAEIVSRVASDVFARDKAMGVRIRKYFAMLYEVMRLIDTSGDVLLAKDRHQFMRIVHSQMSDVESMLLVFYMHLAGNDHLKNMVVHYSLFDAADVPEWMPESIRRYFLALRA